MFMPVKSDIRSSVKRLVPKTYEVRNATVVNARILFESSLTVNLF